MAIACLLMVTDHHLQAKHRWWVYDRWCERSRGKPQRQSDVELDVGAMREAAALLLGRCDPLATPAAYTPRRTPRAC